MVRIPTVKSEGKVTALECIAFTLPTASSPSSDGYMEGWWFQGVATPPNHSGCGSYESGSGALMFQICANLSRLMQFHLYNCSAASVHRSVLEQPSDHASIKV